MSLGFTRISYLQRSWSPTTGCRGPNGTPCPQCWAKGVITNRLAATMKGLPPGDPFTPTFHADRLADPLRVRKPSVIGVSFLGDLFDPGITNEQIAAVFGVMAAAHWHTFVLLTKQARRMGEWFEWTARVHGIDHAAGRWVGEAVHQIYENDSGPYVFLGALLDKHWLPSHPLHKNTRDLFSLPNLWPGVSITGPGDTHRLDDLAACPAAHRWASYEPARAGVDFSPWLPSQTMCARCGCQPIEGMAEYLRIQGDDAKCIRCGSGLPAPTLDAVIMGGLHAPDAAPLNLDWARKVRDDCAAAGCAFALKQDAGARPTKWPLLDGRRHMDVPWAPWLAHGKEDQE